MTSKCLQPNPSTDPVCWLELLNLSPGHLAEVALIRFFYRKVTLSFSLSFPSRPLWKESQCAAHTYGLGGALLP